ncbi:MAG: diacylglycerol kinase family lipid kinase [Polyangiaceae bacterium]|nr:diacylglycerol kinase family lipid kinase [Polyangiaceae bacterium]
MKPPDVRVVLNPRAGAGSAKRLLPEVRRELARLDLSSDVAETEGPRDAGRLVKRAHAEGVQMVAVMGGDGTLNEAAQGYLGDDGGAIEGPDLLVVPAGTGGDFRKTLGIDGLTAAIARARGRAAVPHDLGRLELVDDDGATVTRAFINITSFGIGGVADRMVNESPKWLGGKASYFLGSARAWLRYRNQPMRVRVDGAVFEEGPVFNLAVCNGRYFGGGMKVAPDADPTDGLFDVVSMGDFSRLEGLSLSNKIYAGTHLTSRAVKVTRGAIVEAEPIHPWTKVLIDMDGETPGRLPLRATVLRGAVRIR